VPLRPNALRAFTIKQAVNETLKYAKDGHRHCSSFFLLTFSTCNILRKDNITLQGKNNAVTTHTVSSAKFTNPLRACREHFRGEFRSPVLQVFAPARRHS
jgi:hypothetical protein